ncbi:MAG: amidohydrolase family protein [Verrucomicrobia bacterium]|nr:amidohydrolase family protein [Verrucomicrobiota bacterium]
MKIDAHQHFWRYSASDYGWIDDTMQALRRDFQVADLAPSLASAGIEGTVAVQARQSLIETDWLLSLASAHPLIKGVVGWVPLREQGSSVGATLDRYTRHPAFKGVRHVLQGEADTYMADDAFNAGLREVTARGLTYDLLVLARQLPATEELVARHPEQSFVLDHIAKPVVQGPPPAEWCKHIRALARHPRVFCKFSGVVTEVPGREWTSELLRPYFEVVLEAFGPHRLMFGSDWPVCLVASDYLRWHRFVEACTANLTPAERAAILGGNATAFYKLAA